MEKIKKIIAGILIIFGTIVMPVRLNGQRSWTAQTSVGQAYCFKTPLVIKQSGYEDIRLKADYRTQCWQFPLYYSWKIGTSNSNHGWEVELTHLKIHLQNNPPEVQSFSVSHGYNITTLNHIWDLNAIILRLGAGVVITHPESVVRDLKINQFEGLFNRGYYLSGASLQIAVEKRIYLAGNFFLSMEGKATTGIAKVLICEGHAIVPHAGLHAQIGLGYSFRR